MNITRSWFRVEGPFTLVTVKRVCGHVTRERYGHIDEAEVAEEVMSLARTMCPKCVEAAKSQK